MTATYVDDVSDDSALESLESDEETLDSPIPKRPRRYDVTQPETDKDSGSRPHILLTEAKKPIRQRKPSAKCRATTDDDNRKLPVFSDVTNKTKVCRKQSAASKLTTSGLSGTYHQPKEISKTASTTASRKDRLLMRPWLVLMANERIIANMSWYNEEKTQIRIPWKHASKSCWTMEDCQLYREWAKHTGKFSESHDDEPKRWKANFRCALNSLPDVVEVKNVGQTRGNNPYKVYELLQQVNKKNSPRKPKRTRRLKSYEVDKQLPLVATTNAAEKSTNRRQMSSPSSPNAYQSTQPNVTQRNATFPPSQRLSSPVIPTVVEEMSELSQDEWPTTPPCELPSYYEQFETSETSEATDVLQSQYRRSHSSTPSESSDYGTDSGILDSLETTILNDDFSLPSELAITSDVITYYNVEDTHAYLLDSDAIYCELQ